MAMISIDPRLRREPSHTRPRAGAKDPFMNDMERDFAAFLDANNVEWEYEPHFYYIIGSTLKKGYCPDFYLPAYDVYIEIYNAMPQEKRTNRAVNELARRKRQRIHILSCYSAKATAMIHPDNWDKDTTAWDDVEFLIYRAFIPALMARTAQILMPKRTSWED